MKRLSTFPKGGVHPPGRKHLAHSLPLQNASIPSLSIVPLSQHIGSPAECVVSVGDVVREGMLIGKPTGFVSVGIHSPVPGTVKELRRIHLPNGVQTDAVCIELAGEFDRLGKSQETVEWENMSAKELLDLFAQMGIVGMGGATFPTHVKFSPPKGSRVEFFVINGVECEPYLCADHRLMLEKIREIFEGLRVIRKILDPEQVLFAIEANKPDAIEAVMSYCRQNVLDVKVMPLHVKYPQGDEKQVLKALTGREVPSGGLPIDIGAVVSNVGTVNAIYEAVCLKKPLIERALTVSGGAVKNPANLKARIGTPVSQLLEECGGFSEMPEKIVMGGPMMGFTVLDLDTPVTKGTSGILALTGAEIRSANQTACISCGSCISVCPLGLNPRLLYKLVDHLDYGGAVEAGLMDCKECGCCGFVCPAHIPLVQGMRLGKRIHLKNRKKA
ncbi:MAG: electron transport complex subunit RsxC [Spirochaetales bacterium]|nr:electron transport complex subunit RsxC [Spirochaetales bacterium]